jgi:putative transcriptional regulator
MKERKTTTQVPYQYDLSGLSNVYLVGITVRTCPNCKAETPVIPRIAELHRILAHALVHKPAPLTGKEVRFLRKQEGFPAQKFAALLAITPEHLSRFENGHTPTLGASTDRLARAIATIVKDGEAAREILLQMAEDLEKKPPRPSTTKHLVKLEQNRWKAATQAAVR